MLDRLTGKPVHLFIHLLACCGIAAGLPLSKIPLSLGTMLLILNLLLQADFKAYGRALKTNKLAWGLWAFILIEWLSLVWSSDWNYALHDFNTKLPLYAITLALIVQPVREKKHLYLIGLTFLISLLFTSVINTGSYQHWWGNHYYDDIRGMSLFCSHIRYSLMIVMGIVICIGWILLRLRYFQVAFLLIIWFSWYTWYSQILSGYSSLFIVLLTGVLFLVRKLPSRKFRFTLAGATLLGIIAGVAWLVAFFQPESMKISLKNPDKYTANGNWYRTDTVHIILENGYPVVAFISETELEKSWNRVSGIDYRTGKDAKDQPLYLTLWRYMSSKGLRKDSLGFSSMSKEDIQYVEQGLASIKLTEAGFMARLYGLKHQLEHPENPNGHSLLQRLQYWKAARTILRENWLTGVGSGDVDKAFRSYYATHTTYLKPELQLRAHNQYLTSWISSGILGLLAFLIWWITTLRFAWKKHLFVFCAFTGIAMGSFLVEDTLETQMGVTFVAFFYGLFVGYYGRKTEDDAVTNLHSQNRCCGVSEYKIESLK